MSFLTKFKVHLIWGALAGVLIWAYLGERDNRIIANEEKDQLISLLEGEKEASETLQRASERQLAQERELHQNTTNALTEAREAAELATMGSLDRDLTIQRLQLEAFNAEAIPDSNECLNVNIRRGMLYTGDCNEDADSGDNGNPVCGDPSRANSGDPAFNH